MLAWLDNWLFDENSNFRGFKGACRVVLLTVGAVFAIGLTLALLLSSWYTFIGGIVALVIYALLPDRKKRD